MADIFVKTDGNDSNNGSTWALAKATIEAGLALVPDANGGHRVIIAPGVYSAQAYSSTHPPYAGLSANKNSMVGDTREVYTDSAATTHGKGKGHVIQRMINGSTTAVGAFGGTGTYWNHWEIIALDLIGYSYGFVFTASAAPNNIAFRFCSIYANSQPINFGAGMAQSDGDQIIIDHCYLRGITGQSIYSSGLTGFTSSPPVTPNIVVKDSVLVSEKQTSLLFYNTEYTNISIARVTIIPSNYGIQGYSNTVFTGSITDVLVMGGGLFGSNISGLVFATRAGNNTCAWIPIVDSSSPPAGVDEINEFFNMPVVDRPVTIIQGNGPITGSDLHGLTYDGGCGAQSIDTSRISNPYDGAGIEGILPADYTPPSGGGGAFPIVGGMIVRKRNG